MNEELPELPDDVLALLKAEQPLVQVDAARRARAFAKLEASIVGVGAAATVAHGFVTIAKKKLALAVVGAFAAGTLTGGVVVIAARSETPAPSAPRVAMPSERSTSTPPAEIPNVPLSATVAIDRSPVPSVAIEALPSAKVPPVVATPESSAGSAAGLAAERALLDIARAAFARGEPNEALVAAQRHAKDYPQGVLTEERDALAIRALAAMGRRDEASARAQKFRTKYPKSLLLPAIDSALRDIEGEKK